MFEFSPVRMTERMKVVLVIWHPQNRALLSEVLWNECELLAPDADGFARADLIIVDGPALGISGREVRAARAASDPVFLPVLFISSRPEVPHYTHQLWEMVDDVITRPIQKDELRARVRSLLKARRLSLRLRESRVMYEREHEIAERLQHAALPQTLPRVPGFEFDAFYGAAGNQARVGGDWYDAVCLPDGRILISIGDVCGVGLEAAVTMASIRQAIRAVAQIYANPVTILDAADRTLKEEQPDRVVTAFVGVIDPVEFTLTYASAGHPPPLMRASNGEFFELRAQSLPLGLRVREESESGTAEIPVGSTIVFYTDGLLEARRDLADGEHRVRRALADERVRSSPTIAARIKEAVYDGAEQADDVALLTLRVTPAASGAGIRRWYLESKDAQKAHEIRSEFARELERRGATPQSLFACELIFGELIGNVVRYAAGKLEIVLDLRCGNAVLHFLDNGKGFTLVPRLPTDLLSERGRGLYLIWRLSEDFNVDVRVGGGTHARVVLPVKRHRWATASEPDALAALG